MGHLDHLAAPSTGSVLTWEDDPGEPPSSRIPVFRPVPDLSVPPLPTAIDGPVPEGDGGVPGSAAFRYWTAADALSRGSEVWGPLMPEGVTWYRTVGERLTAYLDVGERLNAYYDRRGIAFFHSTVLGVDVFSGASPDVTCHEMGHAVLDALRPQLWNVASAEADALHESFGDVSALLAALRLESVREAVLTETHGHLEVSSRVSRVAEQLGWALRQRVADGVDENALRDAANRHFYRDPVELPPTAPASQLSSEPHNFSRVFTGAFLKVVAGVYCQQERRDADGLARAGEIAGELLARAIVAAPIVSGYFAQVAAHMIAVDQQMFGGRYGPSLRSAFIRHGIVSVGGATALTAGVVGERARGIAEAVPGADGEELASVTVPGDVYGLVDAVTVTAPGQEMRFSIAGSDPAGGAVAPAPPRRVALAYLEDLLRRGRVEVADDLRGGTFPFVDGGRTQTHQIAHTESAGGLELVRRFFD